MGKKKGTDDRKVALENVTEKVSSGSLDDLRHVRRLLTTQGDEGKQDFNEIRAQALKDL